MEIVKALLQGADLLILDEPTSVLTPQEAVGLRIEGPYKIVTLSDGTEISSHLLMLALGVAWKRLPAEGAERLTGSGVYYGSAPTEALFARGKTVYMVGGGNSVGQAAMFRDWRFLSPSLSPSSRPTAP